jgi:hypothetical protein
LAGWRRPSFVSTAAKSFRSSATSIDSGEVPMMFTPLAFRPAARLSGVWPPNWTMAPSQPSCW